MSQDDTPNPSDPGAQHSAGDSTQSDAWILPPDRRSRRTFLRNAVIGSAAAAAVGAGGVVAASPIGPRLVSRFTPLQQTSSPGPCPAGQTLCGNVCCGSLPNATGTCNQGVCVLTCDTGFSNCDSTVANGCECATPICCGSACGDTHSNGLGQNFYDCVAPGTYNVTQADEARAVWPISGTDATATCGTAGAVYRQTATSCAVWVYSGTTQGHVHLNATGTSCICPSISDPTWN